MRKIFSSAKKIFLWLRAPASIFALNASQATRRFSFLGSATFCALTVFSAFSPRFSLRMLYAAQRLIPVSFAMSAKEAFEFSRTHFSTSDTHP